MGNAAGVGQPEQRVKVRDGPGSGFSRIGARRIVRAANVRDIGGAVNHGQFLHAAHVVPG